MACFKPWPNLIPPIHFLYASLWGNASLNTAVLEALSFLFIVFVKALSFTVK